MEFLGVGPLELFFILIIALIVLGPNDMVKAGRTIGRFMRKVVTSPTWRTVQDTSRELRNLPYKLMREAGVEELRGELNEPRHRLTQELRDVREDLSPWTTTPQVIQPPKADPEDRPPSETTPPTEGSPD